MNNSTVERLKEKRPNIKDYFQSDVTIKEINNIFLENTELYNFILALDNYIDEILKDSYNNEISNDGTNCTNPATNLSYTLDELYQIPKRTGCTFEELIERVTGKKPEKTYSKEEVIELLKKQRENCKNALIYYLAGEGEFWENEINIVLNAPQPTLKGE